MSVDFFPKPGVPETVSFRQLDLNLSQVQDSSGTKSAERVAMSKLIRANLTENKVEDYERRAGEYDSFMSRRFKIRVSTGVAAVATVAIAITAAVIDPLIAIAAIFTLVGALVGAYHSFQSKDNPYETLDNPKVRERLTAEYASAPFSEIDGVLKGKKRNGVSEDAIKYDLLPLNRDKASVYLYWEQLVERVRQLDEWNSKQQCAVEDIYNEAVADFNQWYNGLEGEDKASASSYYTRGERPVASWRRESLGQIEAQYKESMEAINKKWDEIKKFRFAA